MVCPELDTRNAWGWLQLPRLGPCRKHGRPQLLLVCASGQYLSLCLPSLTPRMLFCLLGSPRPFTIVFLSTAGFHSSPLC